MKKIILFFCIFCFLMISIFHFATNKYFQNKLKDTHFVEGGYLSFDLNSFRYSSLKDTYSINVMEELDPGGDIKNIKCPYGEGYITHLIFSTKYSPKQKFFIAKYKGFVCSIGRYNYKNLQPISFQYEYKGVYYDKDTSFLPNFNMDYFDELKKEINNPNANNYFGFVKNIKNQI